jgi:DNA polymerase III epsilon subunit-like protein
MAKLLVIDTEGGGYNPLIHSLLTAALVVLDGKDIIAKKEFYIRHNDYVVTSSALNANKINLVEHDKMASEKEVVVKEMIDFIKLHFSEERPSILGQNVKFDTDFISTLFTACNEDLFDYISHKAADTMHFLRFLYLSGNLKEDIIALDRAIKYFGIIIENRHTAMGDAVGTAELFIKIQELFGGIRI